MASKELEAEVERLGREVATQRRLLRTLGASYMELRAKVEALLDDAEVAA